MTTQTDPINQLSASCDPFRETDWRWVRACQLVDQDRRVRHLGDNYIRRACRYLRLQRAGDDYTIQLHLRDVSTARDINSRGDGRIRWAIEARLLAGESDDAIASKCGTDAATIDMYEHLFFSVRDRLDQSDYIVHHVMSPAVQSGLAEHDSEALWKMFGYFAGVKVLDLIMYQFGPRGGAERPADQYLADHSGRTMARKAALAAQLVPINGFTAGDILNVYVRFLELEQKAHSSGQSRSLFAKNVEAMLQQLPFTTGSRAAEELGSHRVLQLDDHGAELSGSELLLAHAGGDVGLPDEPVFVVP